MAGQKARDGRLWAQVRSITGPPGRRSSGPLNPRLKASGERWTFALSAKSRPARICQATRARTDYEHPIGTHALSNCTRCDFARFIKLLSSLNPTSEQAYSRTRSGFRRNIFALRCLEQAPIHFRLRPAFQKALSSILNIGIVCGQMA
jgi:hypothetical protein